VAHGAFDLTSEVETADIARRFGGIERLYGKTGAAKIFASHVVVVGIGGVGSWAAEALCRSGVGRITLIDMDHVAESNVNRQVHALTQTVGQAKIEAMRERMRSVNPSATVHGVDDFVTAENWPEIVAELAVISAVIDACDDGRAKLALCDWALSTKTPIITVGAAGGKTQAWAMECEDLSEVTHDPLLASLRQRLRKLHPQSPKKNSKVSKIGVSAIFSRETVRPADPSCAIDGADSSLNCHGYGSSVAVTAAFGMAAAGYVMDRLADV
jgi:tRNA A37 threonylcarbamoyladenosine dehydratase